MTSGPGILLVTGYRDDPIAGILKAQGFNVRVVEDTQTLSPGLLTGARAVILNNVPAYELPGDFTGALTFFVN